LVLCNLDAAKTTYESRQIVKDWVEDGGRLVVLGGSETLGQGAMANTYFEDLLPVSLKGPRELVRCDPPLPMTWDAGGNAPEDRPSVFWRHDIVAKGGAAILARAGKHPLASTWNIERGRVTIFAGSTLGEQDEHHVPFWNTQSWAELLRRMALAGE